MVNEDLHERCVLQVEFKLKTIQPHGVVMVTSPSPGRSDFFAVELSDGDLYALFNLGGRTQRFLIGSGFEPFESTAICLAIHA